MNEISRIGQDATQGSDRIALLQLQLVKLRELWKVLKLSFT